MLPRQRVVAVLESGLRMVTDKSATLMALAGHRIENIPQWRGDVLRVPIPDLAHQVPEISSPPVCLFQGRELRRSTGHMREFLLSPTYYVQ